MLAGYQAAVAAAGDMFLPGEVAAIGYCFGGIVVQELARFTPYPLKGGLLQLMALAGERHSLWNGGDYHAVAKKLNSLYQWTAVAQP